MTRTPWGDASELRDRKLPPGRGTPRKEAERNQRERLFAAMVATVAEKGYEATTVADIVELSGVSRSAFYRHYEDRQACFLAAIEAMVGPALERIRGDEDVPAGPERAKEAFGSLIGLIVEQPAAAKMCLVEVYAAGPEGAALIERTLRQVEELAQGLFEQMPDHQGMPEGLVHAIVGGIQKVIHKRLYRDQAAELPGLVDQMWDWIFCYPVPPGPLRPVRRRSVKTLPFEERQAVAGPPERLLRALAAVVAEKGYPDTTVADVVERAGTSQRTFYEHFKNKEDAVVAALDSGSAHMLAAALPAFRRAPDWKHAVHDTIEAMFAFGAKIPRRGAAGGAPGRAGPGRRAPGCEAGRAIQVGLVGDRSSRLSERRPAG